jgi:hypothetical protein
VGKSQFSKIYIYIKNTKNKKEKRNKMKWTGLGLYWPSHKAGLSPARTGWADVPAQSKKGLDSAQLCGLG